MLPYSYKNNVWSPLYPENLSPSTPLLSSITKLLYPLSWMILKSPNMCPDYVQTLYTGYCALTHNPYQKTSQEKLSGFSFSSPHSPPPTHISQFIFQHTLIWPFSSSCGHHHQWYRGLHFANTDGHVSIFILHHLSTSLHTLDYLLLFEALNWFF